VPYTVVADVRLGVDRSRPIYAGASGSVWVAKNGHLTRGGDFEKRKAFVAKYALPANTFGMKATASSIYVFGSAAAPTVPSGITYQQLAHADGVTAMTALLSAELYTGKIYAIAEYADGAVHHFYDGTRITDWDGGTGNPTTKGRTARTLQRKVYSAGGSLLSFSGVDTATGWTTTTDTGAGQITMSNHLAGSETLTALAVYQAKLAVFSRYVVQIWLMFADPADNAQDQVLENTGTRAPKSVLSFGDNDVFYLADSGIRSLRARDSTNTAGVNDIGTSIDSLIGEWVADLTDDEVEAAVAVVEPYEGRFWMAIGEQIAVFSYFPSKKIAGWTWYEPGFTISDFTTLDGRVYARSGNTIYLYGGDDGAEYGTYEVELQLPFLSSGKPGHNKQVQGFDVAASGEWTVDLLVDPNDLDVEEHCGTLDGVTFGNAFAGHASHHTHIAPRLRNETAGYASVSNVAVYFQGADSEGGTQ